MRTLPLLSFMLSVALLMPVPAMGQDTDPELPDIAPHEIEIRGRLEISFPALERQPLVGFNPPPSVPSIPASHRPYVEEYKQDPDTRRQQLPGLGELPELAQRPEPNMGELEAQVGRYYSRIGRARFDVPVTEQQRISFDLDYEGQDRYTPFSDTTFAPHDFFDGHAVFSSSHDAISLGAEVRGHLDRYAMHQPYDTDFDDTQYPTRENYGGQGMLWLRHDGSVPASVNIFYGTSAFTADQAAGTSPSAQEQTYGFDSEVDARLGDRLTSFSLRGSFANQQDEGTSVRSIGLLQSELSTQILRSQSLNVSGGVHLFAAGNAPDGLSPESFEYYAAPIVEATWQPVADLSIYAQNAPSGQTNRWRDLFETNPYLLSTPTSHPTVTTVDAESGITLYQGPVQLNAHGGYRYSPSYQYFEEPAGLQNLVSSITTGYGSAQVAYAGGDISLRMGESVHASVGATYRETQLIDEEQPIPYVAPFTGRGMLSVSFAEQRGLLQMTGRYESSRPASTDFDDTVDPYLSLNARGAYDFTPSIGIIIEAQNIGPASMLEQWSGHPRPPLLVTSGLRIRL